MLRPARLRIWKRRWRCRELLCSAKTWTEPLEFLDAQVVLARRTGAEACRRVGELARPVSQVADEFGVCWETIMNAVVEHGTPLVDDPTRIGRVRQLGVDETSFLRANRHHHTIHATGLVDLEGHQMTGLVDLEGHQMTGLVDLEGHQMTGLVDLEGHQMTGLVDLEGHQMTGLVDLEGHQMTGLVDLEGHQMTGLVDLEGHQMIDMIQGNAAVDLREWTANADPAWLAGIQVVATDLASRCAPGCRHASIMPPVSPTHSTSFGSRTAASMPCDDAFRTRRSAIGDARTIRSIGSANCFSPDPSGSTNAAENGSCCRCAAVTPTMKSSAPGWQRECS